MTFDPVAMAQAHKAAIDALERAGDRTHAETLRVHGTECLRLARIGQKAHDDKGRELEPTSQSQGVQAYSPEPGTSTIGGRA